MAIATELNSVRVLVSGLDRPERVADVRSIACRQGEAGQVYRITPDGHVDEIANTDGLETLMASSDETRYVRPYAVIALTGAQAQPLSMPTNVPFHPDGRIAIASLGGWHLAERLFAAH